MIFRLTHTRALSAPNIVMFSERGLRQRERSESRSGFELHWRLKSRRTEPPVHLQGNIDLPGLLKKFGAPDANRHSLSLLAQIDRLLSETAFER
jgi:hypothetical protein